MRLVEAREVRPANSRGVRDSAVDVVAAEDADLQRWRGLRVVVDAAQHRWASEVRAERLVEHAHNAVELDLPHGEVTQFRLRRDDATPDECARARLAVAVRVQVRDAAFDAGSTIVFADLFEGHLRPREAQRWVDVVRRRDAVAIASRARRRSGAATACDEHALVAEVEDVAVGGVGV